MVWTLFLVRVAAVLAGGCIGTGRDVAPRGTGLFPHMEDDMYDSEPGGTTIKLPSITELFILFCVRVSKEEIELPSSKAMSMSRSSRSSSIISSTAL
jgi:hypothetical protein